MKRPLLIPIISFLAGIFASSQTAIPISRFFILFALALVLILFIATIKSKNLFYVLVCVLFLLLGFLRYSDAVMSANNDISKFISDDTEKVLIYGTVTSSPEQKGKSFTKHKDFPFKVEHLLVGEKEREVSGTVLVRLYGLDKNPEIGDRLVLGGKISYPAKEKNPGGFDYRSFLKHKGIHATMSCGKDEYYLKTGTSKGISFSVQRFLHQGSNNADRIINKYLSGTTKAVARAVTLGRRNEVSDEVSDIFIKTGTMHILAVSGLHIGIVGIVFMALLRLLGIQRTTMYYLTIIGICVFAIFTGGRPSSLRAAIMGSFVIVGLLLDRKIDIVNALALSAFIITFFVPGQLFNAGFILSYLAVLSIVFITPFTDSIFGITKRAFKEKKSVTAKRYFLKSLSVSTAIWIGMMPIIVAYYSIVTPSVILTNLIAVPALFLLVIFSFGLIITGSISFLEPVSVFIAHSLNVITTFLTNAMGSITHIPFSFMYASSLSPTLVAIFYGALIAVVVWHYRTKKTLAPAITLCLLMANLFVWNEVMHAPPDELRVTFFATGKSDATLMEFPDGKVVLVDGGTGGAGGGIDVGRNVVGPYLRKNGIRHIDCIFLTHPHEDHIGGLLYILKNFSVGIVFSGIHEMPKENRNWLYGEFSKIVEQKNIEYKIVKRGDIVAGFGQTQFMILNPPAKKYGNTNNDSVVMKASSDEIGDILFCADVGSQAMTDILLFGSLLQSDILKTPHHGMGLGSISTVKNFLKVINAESVIITNTKPSRLNKNLVEELSSQGVKVYLTGVSGAIVAEGRNGTFYIKGYLDRRHQTSDLRQ